MPNKYNMLIWDVNYKTGVLTNIYVKSVILFRILY